jgi:CheY-like chemotaxis protein
MSEPKFPGLSVLIIDDIRASRALLRALLQSFGISDIMEAGDSVVALEILGITRRDVVITDLLMHPMDGIEFIRTFAETRRRAQPLCPGTDGLRPYRAAAGQECPGGRGHRFPRQTDFAGGASAEAANHRGQAQGACAGK